MASGHTTWRQTLACVWGLEHNVRPCRSLLAGTASCVHGSTGRRAFVNSDPLLGLVNVWI
jgi:hypothetical protein